MASQTRSKYQAMPNAAAMSGAPTSARGAYTWRHQRCSMVRPRSIASHGERRRSATAMLAGCMRAPGEQEIGEQHGPAGDANSYFYCEANLRQRRPEGLDEGGGHEHERRAVHDAHGRL